MTRATFIRIWFKLESKYCFLKVIFLPNILLTKYTILDKIIPTIKKHCTARIYKRMRNIDFKCGIDTKIASDQYGDGIGSDGNQME